jgi:hypothetical protein
MRGRNDAHAIRALRRSDVNVASALFGDEIEQDHAATGNQNLVAFREAHRVPARSGAVQHRRATAEKVVFTSRTDGAEYRTAVARFMARAISCEITDPAGKTLHFSATRDG